VRLLAEKDSEHLFIKFDPIPNFNSIRHFSGVVQRYGGKGILISDLFDEKNRSIAMTTASCYGQERNRIKDRRALLAGAFGQYGMRELQEEKAKFKRPFRCKKRRLKKSMKDNPYIPALGSCEYREVGCLLNSRG